MYSLHSMRVCCTHVVRAAGIWDNFGISAHHCTLLGRPSMLLDVLFPAHIAKQFLCMVFRHFTETTPQKTKPQQTDRDNTPLLLRWFFSTSPENPGVRKWQNKECCEASHSCSFHGRSSEWFHFRTCKRSLWFSQHHRYFLGLSFPFYLPYDYCLCPLAPTQKQTSNESWKQ